MAFSRRTIAAIFGACAAITPLVDAQAAIIVDIYDDASNIHAQSRGTFTLPSEASYGTVGTSFMYGNQPSFAIGGATGGLPYDISWNLASPLTHLFGTRGVGNASFASGPLIGFSTSTVFIDQAYVPGTELTSYARWDGWTLALAELVLGVHTYALGNDTITLAIGDAAITSLADADVPVPAALPMLLGALGLFGVATRRKRRAR